MGSLSYHHNINLNPNAAAFVPQQLPYQDSTKQSKLYLVIHPQVNQMGHLTPTYYFPVPSNSWPLMQQQQFVCQQPLPPQQFNNYQPEAYCAPQYFVPTPPPQPQPMMSPQPFNNCCPNYFNGNRANYDQRYFNRGRSQNMRSDFRYNRCDQFGWQNQRKQNIQRNGSYWDNGNNWNGNRNYHNKFPQNNNCCNVQYVDNLNMTNQQQQPENVQYQPEPEYKDNNEEVQNDVECLDDTLENIEDPIENVDIEDIDEA